MQEKGSTSHDCCPPEVTVILTENLVKPVIQNLLLCLQLPSFLHDACALWWKWEAPMTPEQDRSLTQSSICLDISGTSTGSFSAVTIKAGIRICGRVTGSGSNHRRKESTLLVPLHHSGSPLPRQGHNIPSCSCFVPSSTINTAPLTTTRAHYGTVVGPGFVSPGFEGRRHRYYCRSKMVV